MNNKIKFDIYENNKKAFEECKEFIKKMQKVMKIQDWDILLNFMTFDQITGFMQKNADFIACCKKDWHLKVARIGINIEHPCINENLEKNILHELIHIVTGEYERQVSMLCDLANNEYAKATLDLLLEQMVEQIATSIYNSLNEEVINE